MKTSVQFHLAGQWLPAGCFVAALWLGGLPEAGAQGNSPVPIQARLMHLTPEQRQQMRLRHLAAPQLRVPLYAQPAFASSVNLLPRVPYVPQERDQGWCGDCWQWAGTGVMEVAHDVQDGIHNRLSVQFINSCQQQVSCCDGGWLEYVAYFYSKTRNFAIPWTNVNAGWSSGGGFCTAAPCGTIGTNFNYPIERISSISVPTWGVGQAQAINNIKNVLSQNKAVFFAFWLPNSTGWPAFDTFWSTQPESAVWTNFYCGQPSGSGHAVLCVGYNDDDANNPYWIILNSWGASSLRPNGLFRVTMNLDYDCADNYGFNNLEWDTLDMKYVPLAPTIDSQPQDQTVVLGSSAVFRVTASSPQLLSYQWRKQGVPIEWATNATCTISNAQFFDAGAYSVVVSTPYGSVTSSNANLTVVPPVTLAFALNDTNDVWVTDTNLFWYGQTNLFHNLTNQYDNTAAAQTYPLSVGQQCSLVTTALGPSTLTFWWKIASQASNDTLSFTAWANDWTNTAQIAGQTDWSQPQVLLPSGPVTLQWVYAKNASGGGVADAAWLDQVTNKFGCTRPNFLTQPTNQNTLAANAVTFSGSADGTPFLYYQWLFNGAPIPGATNASLTLDNPNYLSRGTYTFQATNCCGCTNSSAALTVVPLVARGDNTEGQLALSLVASNAIGVAAGAWHTLVLRADGSLMAFGENCMGQATVPPGLTNIMTIAAGGYHSLALLTDGTVVAWGGGDNAYGQTNVPAGLSNVVAVAGGTWHSMALRAEGTVKAWGDDSFGQCDVPADLTGVIAIAAGGNHSLALRADGSVVAWGENTDPMGNYAGQSDVPWGLANVVAIGAGDYHSLAVRADGTVVGWGDNAYGQCHPPPGLTLTNAVAAIGGGSHSIAIKADTTIAVWGDDWDGLADFPPTLSNIVAIATGNSHTVLLEGDSFAPPLLLQPSRTGRQFKALLQTYYGRQYALECKTNLASPDWTALRTNAGNGAVQMLIDTNAVGSPQFYRARRW